VNDFVTDLAWSFEIADDQSLDAFYRKTFPHLERIEKVQDLALQRRGIDKILHMKSGKSYFVDEKKRRTAYPDILIEEYSDFDRRRVGWIGKDKYTDYLVYAIMPTQTVYLFPFLLLQLAWLRNYSQWLARYGRKFAANKGYRTSNIAVPGGALIDAIRWEMCQTEAV